MPSNDWSSSDMEADGERGGFTPLRRALSVIFAVSWVTVAGLMVAFGVPSPLYVFFLVMFAITWYVEFKPPRRGQRC
ncbi:hypothetical protein [Mycobacterium sp. DBP42]|uniref:hypothetical protein n=1 Tax=Mycobacteriaceae TaxID=1762 RepID=UPI00110CEFFE|nr:hypothetical protein [Mycobacterium sp. DBP42]TMS45423.1 hypothetical protein E0T84_31060 [Mycobacterium sp. DBP42]